MNHILLVGSDEGDIECWDLECVRFIETIKNDSDPVSCLAVIPFTHNIVAGQGNNVYLWK